MEEKPSRAGVLLALLAVYLIWGSTYLAGKLALQSYPPMVMGAVRFALAGGCLYVFARARGEAPPTRRQWAYAAAIGALLFVCGSGLVAFAQQRVDSGLAAIMVAAMPLWAGVFGGVFGTWPSRSEWASLALGIAGVVLINLDANLRANLPSALALVASPMLWAFGSVWSRRVDLPRGFMASAAMMLTASLLFAVLAGSSWATLQRPTVTATAALLYLILFGSLVGFSAYQYLLSRTHPSVATSYAYVNPVIAVLLGVFLGRERLTPHALAGGILVSAAVAWVVAGRRPQPQSVAFADHEDPRSDPRGRP